MKYSVVCISHTDGSGGEEIGRRFADRLGLRYIDDEVIVQAARLAQVDPALVAATEHKQTLLQRILDGIASAQSMLGSATLASGVPLPASQVSIGRTSSTKEDLRTMIRAAIHELGRQGNAVIAAHAASHALAGKAGVLRVLITAPADVRARRIATARGLTDKQAGDAVSAGDDGRREYLRSFYDLEDEAPTHYDVVINSEALAEDEAVAILLAAATAVDPPQ